jgi:hypothetical protein
VLDRSAEEGTNLQFIDGVLHLDVPTVSSRLEHAGQVVGGQRGPR